MNESSWYFVVFIRNSLMTIDVGHIFIIILNNHSFRQHCEERLHCYHLYLAAEETDPENFLIVCVISTGKEWEIIVRVLSHPANGGFVVAPSA